jgi:hypothetical protein
MLLTHTALPILPAQAPAAAPRALPPHLHAGCNMPATFFVLEAGNDCNLAKAFWEQNSEVRSAVAAQACCVCAAGWNGMCGVEP